MRERERERERERGGRAGESIDRDRRRVDGWVDVQLYKLDRSIIRETEAERERERERNDRVRELD